MAFILDNARAKVIIVGQEFVGHIEAIEDQLAAGTIVVVVDGGHDRWTSYAEFVDAQPASDPHADVAPDDVAFLIFTSGTTGLPKGAMMTQRGFFAAFSALDQWRLDENSVPLAMMPMFHFAGSGWSLLSLGVGCTTVLLRDVDPKLILDAIERFGVTNIVMPPAVIQFLLATPEVETTDFSSLRAILYGGSPITETVLERATKFFDCEFLQLYGLTETAGGVAQLDGVDHDPVNRPHLMRSCGKPYPWVELRIVDATTGEDVPNGTVGEIWVRAPQNMPGYWRNPEATAETITPDGWLRTGDAAVQDEDGYLYLRDRVNDMIVSGAENIYPAEVENALMRDPSIADVAVIGVPDDRWGEAVKAIVVKAPGHSATPEEIIESARQHIAGYKLPKSVDFTEELPRNASGKVLRRVLREPYWAGRSRAIS
jgi:long-chain acyl-CoA synthetase